MAKRATLLLIPPHAKRIWPDPSTRSPSPPIKNLYWPRVRAISLSLSGNKSIRPRGPSAVRLLGKTSTWSWTTTTNNGLDQICPDSCGRQQKPRLWQTCTGSDGAPVPHPTSGSVSSEIKKRFEHSSCNPRPVSPYPWVGARGRGSVLAARPVHSAPSVLHIVATIAAESSRSTL